MQSTFMLQPDQKLTWVQKTCECTTSSVYKAGGSFSLCYPYFWQYTSNPAVKQCTAPKKAMMKKVWNQRIHIVTFDFFFSYFSTTARVFYNDYQGNQHASLWVYWHEDNNYIYVLHAAPDNFCCGNALHLQYRTFLIMPAVFEIRTFKNFFIN